MGSSASPLPREAAKAVSHVNRNTTDVRTAVATFESIPVTPIFARIAVAAANRADNTDRPSQFISFPLSIGLLNAQKCQARDTPRGPKEICGTRRSVRLTGLPGRVRLVGSAVDCQDSVNPRSMATLGRLPVQSEGKPPPRSKRSNFEIASDAVHPCWAGIRQPHPETRTLPYRTSDLNLRAVESGDLLRDRKAQTISARAAIP